MSKLNEQAQALIARLEEKTTVNDKNTVLIDGGVKVWEENLPEGITIETVKKVAEYRENFGNAYDRVVSKRVVEHAKSNPDIANMEHRLETPDVTFGFSFARPDVKEGKPTRAQFRSGIAFHREVRLDPGLEEVANELANLWDLED